MAERPIIACAAGMAVLATLLVLGVLAWGAAPAGAARSCGTLALPDGARVHVKVIRRSTCATARTVLRRYLTSTAPCSGSACRRRQGGWTCASAAAFAWPRLASCARDGARAATYSLAG
jgi:hypothetical protein